MTFPFWNILGINYSTCRFLRFVGKFSRLERISMGLTDRRTTAKNLADSRKNGTILTVSRK